MSNELLNKPPNHASLNHIPNLISPSGEHRLEINSQRGMWVVSIHDKSENTEYEDSQSTFSKQIKIYWMWDEQDRAWLFRTGDSEMYYYQKRGNHWQKTYWGNADGPTTHSELEPTRPKPPKALLPLYYLPDGDRWLSDI